ncbi:MAG: VanZ family protein [Gemmatimonadota bacterium]
MPDSRAVSSAALFTSDRERRLWSWTLAVVVAIYSTLGLARSLAWTARESDLGVAFFVLGMLLVLATVVTQGLKKRPHGTEIGVALGVAAAYLMVLVRMASPTERSHLMEYGVLAVFIHEALMERASQGRRVPVPALLAILATSVVGALDEGIQAFLPIRVFDPVDILFNVLAAVMAVSASLVLGWARRRCAAGVGSR